MVFTSGSTIFHVNQPLVVSSLAQSDPTNLVNLDVDTSPPSSSCLITSISERGLVSTFNGSLGGTSESRSVLLNTPDHRVESESVYRRIP